MLKTIALFLLLTSSVIHAQEVNPRLNAFFSKAYQSAILNHDSSSKVVVFAQGNLQKIYPQLEEWGISTISKYGTVVRFELPAYRLLELAKNGNISVLEEGKKSAVSLDDSARWNSRVDSVLEGKGNLSTGYTGKGVIMGIVDSGVDYTHGDFRNPGDSLSRILRFYDYNVTPPRAYSQSQVNQNLSNPTLPIDDSWHGSHVAGVAVGNGNAFSRFKGIAPEAFLLVSDLTPQQWFDDIITSTDSMFAFASSQQKPCVVNLSLGSNYGPHDGTDSYSQALESMVKSDSGRAIVIAAGNSTTLFPHLGYTLSNDTNFTYLTASTAYPVYTQTYIQASQTNARFRISLDTLGAGTRYRRFASSPFRSIGNIPSTGVHDTLRHPNQTPYCIVSTYASNYTNNRILIEHEITYLNPAGLKTPLYRFEATGSGSFHLWTEDGRMVTNTTMIGRAFPDSSKYRRPDDRHNMAGYFNCARDLIAVANYTARSAWIPCGTTADQSLGQIAGTISFNSSYGPNTDGFQKPDIGGAGDNTMGARSSNVPTPDNRATLGCFHRRARGTSNAAAVITGALCLYFQAHPTAGWYTIKQDLTQTAIRDGFTGTTPNSLWGYGKLNAMAFVEAGQNRSCRNLQGVSRLKIQVNSIKDSICSGETLNLSAAAQGNQLTYQWLNGGSTSNAIQVQQPGSYRVIVHDATGCTDTSAAKVIYSKPGFVGTITGTNKRIGSQMQLTSSAANWEWQFSSGSVFSTLPGSVNQRNWIATQNGYYRTALFHPNGCTSYSDTFIISAPPSGQYDWVMGLNSNSRARITHLQAYGHQLFWAGVYEDSLSIGSTVYRSKGPRKSNAFLMSTDLAGNFIWFQELSGIYDEEFTSLAVSPQGKLWAAAKFKSSFTYAQITTSNQSSINQNCVLMEIDKSSGIDFKRWILPGNSNRRITSIVCDSSENIYLGGWYNNQILSHFSSGGFDLFIAKIDSNFQLGWSKSEGGVGQDVCTQIYHQNGKIFGTGYLGAMRTPGAFGLSSSGTYNGLFFELNALTGNVVGAENMGGSGLEYGWALTGNGKDKVWVTGSMTRDLILRNQRFSNATGEDFFVSEWNTSLRNWNWVRRSSLGGNERITHLQYDQNQLFLGGYVGTQFQFDQVNTASPNGINGIVGSIDTLGNALWWLRPNPSAGNLATAFGAHQNKFYFGGYQSGSTQYGTHVQTQSNPLVAIIGATSQTNNTVQNLTEAFRFQPQSVEIFPPYLLENGILSFLESAPSSISINHQNPQSGSWQVPLFYPTRNIEARWINGAFFQLNFEESAIKKPTTIDWDGTQWHAQEPATWKIYNLQGQVVFSEDQPRHSLQPPFLTNGIYLVEATWLDGSKTHQKFSFGR